LFDLSDSFQGRAMMQFNDINAFRVGNEVVIMQPNKKPLQFHVVNDSVFTPKKLNEDLAKDALAHVITPFYLYEQRKYRLKSK
jgi:hypothetical protein